MLLWQSIVIQAMKELKKHVSNPNMKKKNKNGKNKLKTVGKTIQL